MAIIDNKSSFRGEQRYLSCRTLCRHPRVAIRPLQFLALLSPQRLSTIRRSRHPRSNGSSPKLILYASSRRLQRGALQGFPLDGGNILAQALRLTLRPFREQPFDDHLEANFVLRLEPLSADRVQFLMVLPAQRDATGIRGLLPVAVGSDVRRVHVARRSAYSSISSTGCQRVCSASRMNRSVRSR